MLCDERAVIGPDLAPMPRGPLKNSLLGDPRMDHTANQTDVFDSRGEAPVRGEHVFAVAGAVHPPIHGPLGDGLQEISAAVTPSPE